LWTDFVCLYNYEFWLSLCKIVRSSVILLLPLFLMNIAEILLKLTLNSLIFLVIWINHNIKVVLLSLMATHLSSYIYVRNQKYMITCCKSRIICFHFFHICISMVYFNFKDIYHYNYVDTLPLPTLTHCLCLLCFHWILELVLFFIVLTN
jgi:hypothetical protein